MILTSVKHWSVRFRYDATGKNFRSVSSYHIHKTNIRLEDFCQQGKKGVRNQKKKKKKGSNKNKIQ